MAITGSAPSHHSAGFGQPTPQGRVLLRFFNTYIHTNGSLNLSIFALQGVLNLYRSGETELSQP